MAHVHEVALHRDCQWITHLKWEEGSSSGTLSVRILPRPRKGTDMEDGVTRRPFQSSQVRFKVIDQPLPNGARSGHGDLSLFRYHLLVTAFLFF
jgi:hypothetical protein